jgi:hypothetical protein
MGQEVASMHDHIRSRGIGQRDYTQKPSAVHCATDVNI